jgi:hypothetical protein
MASSAATDPDIARWASKERSVMGYSPASVRASDDLMQDRSRWRSLDQKQSKLPVVPVADTGLGDHCKVGVPTI